MARRCALLLIGLLTLCPLAGPAFAASRVAVVDCPTAIAWLETVGVEGESVTASGLSTASLTDLQLLVLPMDRLKSDDSLRAVSTFAARGGMVVAVYWGTLARPDRQAEVPAYGATPLLGLKVAGWTTTGPVTVKLDPMAPGG